MKIESRAEEITRYLFDDKHFSHPVINGVAVPTIKKKAIAPMQNEENGEWETSVMLTTGCLESETERIGIEHVAKLRDADLLAYVKFASEVVFDQGLTIVNDKFQHNRHCCIKGWMPSKEDWLEQASDLAEAITAHPSKSLRVL